MWRKREKKTENLFVLVCKCSLDAIEKEDISQFSLRLLRMKEKKSTEMSIRWKCVGFASSRLYSLTDWNCQLILSKPLNDHNIGQRFQSSAWKIHSKKNFLLHRH